MFDEYALEDDDGVREILVDHYGLAENQIEDVDCPADQEVVAGNTFTCAVELGDENPREKTVDITVVSGDGQYEVGRPRGR